MWLSKENLKKWIQWRWLRWYGTLQWKIARDGHEKGSLTVDFKELHSSHWKN